MTALHITLGIAVVAVNLAAGLWGIWCWYRCTPGRLFWPLLRTGQAVLVLQVMLGGLLLVLGHKPTDEIHFLYGLLPLVVSFVAEQLRVAAADMVLSARNLDSAREVDELPEPEQHAIVRAIVSREIGVMAISALVVVALALRAASTAGGF